MKHEVNAIGLACPLPVVNTKKEIQGMSQGETVDVLVDNEIAVQNLTKFANVKGHQVSSAKLDDGNYRVTITVSGQGEAAAPDEDYEECSIIPTKDTVVVLSSNQMGSGEAELGKTLMKAFIFALTKQDSLPKCILLYNSGAYLSCEGSDSLEDLKQLESEGVQIYTCGTCLNFYELTEKLQVGSVTNMYDIVEMMSNAGKVIRP